MLLDSVQILSSFPFEKVGIFLNNSMVPEVSSRLGIRFRSTRYDNSEQILNWNPNLKVVQSGLCDDLLFSETLSGFYDSTQTLMFVQPTSFIDIPSYFPVFFELSSIPAHSLLLNFRGGLSAITVFPSRPYPKITKIDEYNMTVSGVFLPLTAFNSNMRYFDYYPQVDLNSSIQNLELQDNSILLYENSYFSSTKKNILWKKVTTNPLRNTVFNNDIIPSVTPYDKRIDPKSFMIEFPLSAASNPVLYTYRLSYSNSKGNTHYLSGLTIESKFFSALGTTLSAVNPVAKTAYITENPTNKTFGLTVKLDPFYAIPVNSNITYYYETSSFTVSSTVATTNPSVNNYAFSAQNPLYFYNFLFSLSSPSIQLEDAITITYAPSSTLTQLTLSSFALSTTMVDNFCQTTFPIQVDQKKAQLRFIESIGDVTLSAIDTVTNKKYITNQWFPASAYIKFVNNGIANSHTISFQLSTYTNSLYNYGNSTFILNKDKANLTLFLTNITDISAKVEGILFPSYDPNLNIKWSVQPPENIVLRDVFFNNEIQQGQLTPAGALAVNVKNLGVDTTTITLYSEEFDLSASVAWIPTSASYTGTTLALSGIINDFSPIDISPISAFFIKNTLIYPVPETGSITWSESIHSPNGQILFYTPDSIPIPKTIPNPSLRKYSNIFANISARPVPESPQNIPFDITCNTTGLYYNLNANLIFSVREYPSNASVYALISANDGQILNSKYFENGICLKPITMTLSALTGDFSVLDINNLKWSVSAGSSILNYNAVPAITLTATSDFCVSISALSAKPLSGGFEYYDFSDMVCFSVFPNGLPTFQYIAFPEWQFFPNHHLQINDNSYLNSVGVTGLSSCIPQTFIISAFSGFDEYHFLIGENLKISNSNIESISVTNTDITATSAISVSAFNHAFRKNDTLTTFNFASSDNSSAFRQHISLLPLPAFTAGLSSDNLLFDLKTPSSVFLNISFDINPHDMAIEVGNYTYILSSVKTIKYNDGNTYHDNNPTKKLINVNGNGGIFEKFTYNPTDFFSIPKNSASVFNFWITGHTVGHVNNTNGCAFEEPFSTNILSLTAKDGDSPDLLLFTKKHLNYTNQVVYFTNETPSSYVGAFGFDYFIFNDGANHTQIVSSYTDTLTGIYPTEGVFTVSLTGVFPSGKQKIREWKDFIIVSDGANHVFDDDISRQFPDALKLPYSKAKMGINPNDWQFDTKINEALDRVKTNFYYLSNMTSTYDINIPKYFIGWLAEKDGGNVWTYNNDYPTQKEYSIELQDLKDFCVVNERVYIINGNRLEIRNNDFNLTKIYSSDYITEGEKFQTPDRIAFNVTINKLIILDSLTKFVYVFDVTDDVPVLTHYWGGTGSAGSRTKLNNPTDLYCDINNKIFIVDSDSLIIKIYNNFLNWENNITHTEWNNNNKPISVSGDSREYVVLTTKGNIDIFDSNYKFVKSIVAVEGSKIHTDVNHEGMLYIMGEDASYVYTKTGIFLNDFRLNGNIKIHRIIPYERDYLGLTSFSIVKFIDYINIQRVKNENYSLSSWSWDSININPAEPVTAFVYNDTFKRIQDNILLLAKDISYKFVVSLDEHDEFVTHSISAIHADEITLSAISCSPIGINELVTYETINRGFDCVYDNLDALRNMLEVRYYRENGDFICWSWKSQKILSPQSPKIGKKPFSWYELRKNIASKNIYLSSGITWLDMKTCCDEANSSPISWKWRYLTCCDVPYITWKKTRCDGLLMTTWKDLVEDCGKMPIKYFDDCMTIC